MRDVLIVGGGITGCATAWYLAQAGVDVVLVEKSDLNTQASGRNAGSLHGQIQFPSFVERGPEWARAFGPALRLLADSLSLWDNLDAELGVDLEATRNGGILVAQNQEQMAAIEEKVAIERSLGVSSEVISSADLQRLAPYISSSMVGGELCPIEGKANPLIAAPAFAAGARRHGAQIVTQAAVTSCDNTEGGYIVGTTVGPIAARRIVLAAGNGMNEVLRLLGGDLPIIHEPVQVTATEPLAPFVHHLIYYAGGKLTFKQAKAGTLLIGGGWAANWTQETGELAVNEASLRANLAIALRVVPSLGSVQAIRSWAGVGLATPDLMPVLGEIAGTGVFVGTYPHMGLTAGPRMGQLLADMVVGRRADSDLGLFDPARF